LELLKSCTGNISVNAEKVNAKIENKYFINVANFKYLGITVSNKNDIKEEIKFGSIRVIFATFQFSMF
jgi:hypothetical protein